MAKWEKSQWPGVAVGELRGSIVNSEAEKLVEALSMRV